MHNSRFKMTQNILPLLALVISDCKMDSVDITVTLFFQNQNLPSKFAIGCMNQTSADSTVRVLSLSLFCPDFPENHVRCLSAVRICEKILSDVCMSGFFLFDSVHCPDSVRIIEKSYSLSVCPTGQGRDRAVRTFTVLVRRRVRRRDVWHEPLHELDRHGIVKKMKIESS